MEHISPNVGEYWQVNGFVGFIHCTAKDSIGKQYYIFRSIGCSYLVIPKDEWDSAKCVKVQRPTPLPIRGLSALEWIDRQILGLDQGPALGMIVVENVSQQASCVSGKVGSMKTLSIVVDGVEHKISEDHVAEMAAIQFDGHRLKALIDMFGGVSGIGKALGGALGSLPTVPGTTPGGDANPPLLPGTPGNPATPTPPAAGMNPALKALLLQLAGIALKGIVGV